MPIPQDKLDRLTELLVDQLLAEFEKARDDKVNVDPRRLAAAQKLLESANASVLKPAEAPVMLKKKEKPAPDATADEDDDSVPVEVSAIYRTKAMRDKFRKGLTSFLSKRDRRILNSFAEEDGADLIPEQPTPTKGTTA